MEQVILVDSKDSEIGIEEKYACHKRPTKLHRAFSVFILNNKNQLLLQCRGKDKKTWPSVWSNTCCSHPRPNEPVELAAKRRVEEELGFTCDLRFLFKFEYNVDYDNEWGENELDNVFVGYYDGHVKPDPNEIEETKWISLDELQEDIEKNPGKYTPWLRICFKRFLSSIKN